MSTRVSLSQSTYHTTHEEETPVCLRLQLSRATVKERHRRLQHAYHRDEGRLVRRSPVWRALLVYHGPMAVFWERWGLRLACRYAWQHALLRCGLASGVSPQSGGRRPQVTPCQKKRVVALIDAGPPVVGLERACWHALLIRVLLWRECGGLSKRHDLGTWLPNMGVSLQKARGVSAHLDAATASRGGLLLCEEEARLAPWGSLSSTGSRRGPQPAVPTRGQRQGDKGFGALASFAGRFFSPGLAGRFTAEHYHAFFQRIMTPTTPPRFLSHAGARDHTRAAPHAVVAAHRDRMTAEPLPA